jgi:hypothetical protein
MIALTPNIARRRIFRSWQAWVRTLLVTTPLAALIVPMLMAMAFPVIKSGQIMFKGGLMVFGACSCCDGGGVTDCETCRAISDCPRCTGSAHVPSSWAITFAGFSDCDGHCVTDGASPGYSWTISGNANGTYSITGNGCLWNRTDAVSGLTGTIYAGNLTCSGGTVTSYVNQDISFGVDVLGHWSAGLELNGVSGEPPGREIHNADGGLATTCCTGVTYSASSFTDCNGGDSGMITVAPCG